MFPSAHAPGRCSRRLPSLFSLSHVSWLLLFQRLRGPGAAEGSGSPAPCPPRPSPPQQSAASRSRFWRRSRAVLVVYVAVWCHMSCSRYYHAFSVSWSRAVWPCWRRARRVQGQAVPVTSPAPRTLLARAAGWQLLCVQAGRGAGGTPVLCSPPSPQEGQDPALWTAWQHSWNSWNFPEAQRDSQGGEGSTETTANIRKWEYRKIIDRAPYYIIDF